MRLPLHWLHDYCRPGLDAAALAERLDLTGTKVERILHHGVVASEHFVVGRVCSVAPHPDAERLRICEVDVGAGNGAARTIVCGAPNVAAGQLVAVATPGATLADGQQLRAAKLRGIVSDGMILAEDELAIGTDHSGVLVLDDQLAPGGLSDTSGTPVAVRGARPLVPGMPLADVLPIATDVLELELTPNRPDCLGVYGVAREVHAATGAPLAPAPWSEDAGTLGELAVARVDVEDPDLCPRFTARVFEGVLIGPSPAWLKARLMAAGQRPISNVVDITNYVMLLTGQPLHAFDLDRVAGGRLIVRRARPGERLQTLDGVERELDEQMVVVCDEQGPTGIAGMMGGARAEVGAGTTRVLLESATWVGPNIHATSARLGLRTEASARFEKGLAPEAALEAQAVATRLLVELCGATVALGTADVGGPGPAPAVLRLREGRVAGLIGAPIPRERQREILVALGFGVEAAPDGLDVAVPHHRRSDVTREVDLIEEVARMHGMEGLPATLPARRASGRLSGPQRLARRVQDALVERGLDEIAGWSFADPAVAERLRLGADDPRRAAVALLNPMAENQSVLRTTLLASLLDAARHNAAHGTPDVRLFELGAVFQRRDGGVADVGAADAAGEEGLAAGDTGADDGLPRERRHLAAIICGPVRPPTWREPHPPQADVYAAKGLLAAVLDVLRVGWSATVTSEPFLHPGRAGAALIDGRAIGWFGELHPLVAGAWDIDGAAGFEIDLEAVIEAAARTPQLYEELAAFPELHQDLAVTVDAALPAARVVDIVRRAAGPTLVRAEVFDVYRGEQAGEGRVSLALRLVFRSPERTLTDADVARTRERILRELADEVGAVARA